MLELNKIYNGDCLEIMKRIDEKSIDLILTDPPYNIADSSKLTKSGNDIVSNEVAWGNKFKDKWDSFQEYSDWLLNIIYECNRVLKDDGSIIIFLDRKYTGYFAWLFEEKIGLKYRNKIYFEKNNPVPKIRKINYRSCIEEAIWLSKEKYKINFLGQEDMKQIFRGNIGKKDTEHPTEKYKWMIRPLILRHSNPDDCILDPFSGSGTTCLVSKMNNRNYIGIEKDEIFYNISLKRMETFEKQGNLFS